MKYRKKPIVIEAYQTDKELDIETLEGTMHASVGDYIITGVRGEQYPCKPDIFEQTYEPAARPERKKGKWIPVSERLPDDGSEVWATIKGSDVIKVEAGETIEQAIDRVNRIRWVTRAYWSEEEHGWNDPTFGCPLVVKPIAWMPIEKPEPYEGEQE